MLKNLQCAIQEDIEQAGFVVVNADDTTDVSNHLQNVVAFRYIDRTVVPACSLRREN